MSEKSIPRLTRSRVGGRRNPIKAQADYYRSPDEKIEYSFEEMHLLFFVINEKGKIISMNNFLAEHLGYESRELVGKSLYVLINNNDLNIGDFDNRDSGITERLIIQRRDRTEFVAICYLYTMSERNNGKILLLIIESIIDMIHK